MPFWGGGRGGNEGHPAAGGHQGTLQCESGQVDILAIVSSKLQLQKEGITMRKIKE